MARVSFKEGCWGNGIHTGQEQRIIVYLAVWRCSAAHTLQPINHKTINLGQIPLGRLDGGQRVWKNEIHPKRVGILSDAHVRLSSTLL